MAAVVSEPTSISAVSNRIDTTSNGGINCELQVDNLVTDAENSGNKQNGSASGAGLEEDVQLGNGRSSATGFPRYQSPTVTLLQKKRDGTIPKGAVYMLGLMSYGELMNKKNQLVDSVDGGKPSQSSKNIQTKSLEVQQHNKVVEQDQSKSSPSFQHRSQGFQTTNTASADSKETSSTPVGSRCEYYESGGSVGKSQSRSSTSQPNRIEDFEPGHSSLSVENKFENQFHNPPVDLPGQHCQYKDNGAGIDYTIKKIGPMSPTHSKSSVHELYRQIQKGGLIPQHGLQLSPAETRRGFTLQMSNQSQRADLQSSSIGNSAFVPKTRQQKDLENAMRHLRLERAVAEEKRKRLVQQQQDNLARRHSDFYTPFQRAPVSLTRYDEDEERHSNHWSGRSTSSSSSQARGKARALYTFRAQGRRELSFRKGDYLYLLRQIDKNWFYGERHGLRGIFPITYVEVLLSVDEAQNLAAEKEGLARTLYDFSPQTTHELPLKKGDMVKLIRAVDENWYEGSFGGKRGIFPASYVETLVEPDAYLMTPMTSRTVTPMPGPLSPCGSTVSQSIAPTVPSAPLSPSDSELFDETMFSTSLVWQPPPNRLQLFKSPVSVSTSMSTPQQYLANFADSVKDLTRAYSWLDQQTASLKVGRVTESSSETCFGGAPGNFIGSATWSPQSALAQFPMSEMNPVLMKSTSSYSYTQLRYPPYRVQYSYQPRNADELEIRAGDIVYVVEMCDDGWFVGTCERTQAFGTFPGNYVQKIR